MLSPPTEICYGSNETESLFRRSSKSSRLCFWIEYVLLNAQIDISWRVKWYRLVSYFIHEFRICFVFFLFGDGFSNKKFAKKDRNEWEKEKHLCLVKSRNHLSKQSTKLFSLHVEHFFFIFGHKINKYVSVNFANILGRIYFFVQLIILHTFFFAFFICKGV